MLCMEGEEWQYYSWKHRKQYIPLEGQMNAKELGRNWWSPTPQTKRSLIQTSGEEEKYI